MQAQTTSELAWLAEPVAADDPCGPGLEGSLALAALDAQRVFGLLTPPVAEPDWRTIHTHAV